jgi:3-oxoadipate enol-lactonase
MSLVVFLHPIGLDRNTWQFLPPFADQARGQSSATGVPEAIWLDLPGHGDASQLPVLSLEAVADHVAERIEELARPDEGVHVVGLSMGAMVAQHLALRHPQLIASLVIACASAVAAGPVLRDRADAVDRLGMAGVLDDYLTRWFSPDALSAGDHPGLDYARRRLLADDSAVVAAYWRAMAQHDVMARLPRITAPTTVVAGSADKSAPVDKLRDIQSRIPGARLRVVDGPHMLQLESPEAFQAVLAEHLNLTRSAA